MFNKSVLLDCYEHHMCSCIDYNFPMKMYCYPRFDEFSTKIIICIVGIEVIRIIFPNSIYIIP